MPRFGPADYAKWRTAAQLNGGSKRGATAALIAAPRFAYRLARNGHLRDKADNRAHKFGTSTPNALVLRHHEVALRAFGVGYAGRLGWALW